MKNLSLIIASLAALLALGGCATKVAPVTVVDKIASTAELSTLNELMRQSGLADSLRGAGPYTVFAPTNDAFKAMPAQALQALSNDPQKLKAVLSYHVTPTEMKSTVIKNGTAKSVQGANLSLATAGAFITVEDAVVEQPDLAASNGVVHVIDRVLTPPAK
jgi:uncharacterized surface protein with fasciclin (FAS1) repeats